MLRLWYKFLLAILPYYERSPSCLVGSLFFSSKSHSKDLLFVRDSWVCVTIASSKKKQIWIRWRHKQTFIMILFCSCKDGEECFLSQSYTFCHLGLVAKHDKIFMEYLMSYMNFIRSLSDGKKSWCFQDKVDKRFA